MFSLVVSFFIVALLYAMVGFGGGSSYTALLSLTNIPYTLIPKVSLVCNLIVVCGGCYHYWRSGHLNLRKIGPFVLGSVPMAFLGGLFPMKEQTFMLLLMSTLFLSGLRIVLIKERTEPQISPPPLLACILTGAGLGFLSGVVGIGGGIFLSPLMLNFGWASAKDVAATSSVFIFVNSIAGLSGQWIKDGSLPDLIEYGPLFGAVVLGGQLGSWIGSHHRISHAFIRRCTGILVLYVAVRLFLKEFARVY